MHLSLIHIILMCSCNSQPHLRLEAASFIKELEKLWPHVQGRLLPAPTFKVEKRKCQGRESEKPHLGYVWMYPFGGDSLT